MNALATSLLSLFLLAPPGPGWLGVFLDAGDDGAVVREVIPDSPAAKAGIEAGDVVRAVGDVKTPDAEALVQAIRKLPAGTRVNLALLRGGRDVKVVVRLGERPDEGGAGAASGARPERPPQPPALPLVESGRRAAGGERAARDGKSYLGIRVRPADGGVVVDEVIEGGPCAAAGVRGGDRIVAIGDRQITSLEVLDGAMQTVRPGRKLPITVLRDEQKHTLMVRVGSRPAAGAARSELPRRARGSGVVVEAKPREKADRAEQAAKAEKAEKADQDRRAARAKRVAEARKAAAAKQAPAARRAARQARSEAVEAAAPPRVDADRELKHELQQLRQEIRELRRMLEQLRREPRKGGE